MIDLRFLKGRRVAVLGLGRTGLATGRALQAAGVDVTVWDDAPVAREKARQAGLALLDPAVSALDGADMMVLSPGIPRRLPKPHAAVAVAAQWQIPIVSDIDLLAMAMPQARFIGITGTNGKSTTTALIGHVLQAAGVPCAVGGNLGTPVLDLAPLDANGWYVLEVSSFQLETITQVDWSIGVLLNITPDHLDRYDGMADYAAAKARLFRRGTPDAVAVVGVDDVHSRRVLQAIIGADRHRPIAIGSAGPVPVGVSGAGGLLVDGTGMEPEPILDLSDIPALPGVHNWQNAAAAFAVAGTVGIPAETTADALQTFPGLPHRQQLVGEIGGVRFVNDSKATNPEAAARALASYDTIYWIAGGRPKEGGLEALAPMLGNVRGAYLIGEGTAKFEAFLAGQVPAQACGDLATAVDAAADDARRSGRADAVVLLSPACASFDQFKSFEDRGDRFADLVSRRMEVATC